MYAILDIDGCCLDNSARIQHLIDGNASMYHALWSLDVPIPQGVFLYNALLADPKLACIFLTARSEQARPYTVLQLEQLFPNAKFSLLMRPDSDQQDDATFKISALLDKGILPSRVFLAVDDRPTVIAAYRKQGITAYQTNEGW